MEIGFFSSKFPYKEIYNNYKIGGSVLSSYYLIHNLLKLGHKIYVFTSSRYFKDSFSKDNNINVYRYGSLKILSSNISPNLFYKPLKHKFDICHVSFDIPPAPFSALKYIKKYEIPLVVTYHGDWIENYGGFIRKFGVKLSNRYITENLLDSADIIISPSINNIKNSKYLSKYEEKVTIIPNGININEFNINISKKEVRKKLGLSNDNNIILFLGHLSPHKGPEILLESLPLILKEIPQTEIIFIGKGILKEKLQNKAKKLQIEKKIKFLGEIWDNSTKSLYFRASDVFVLPSLSESFGIVNLEAMAFGIPIVASNVGGVPDLIQNDVNGYLFPPNDIKRLSELLIYTLKNKNKVEKMAKRNISKVKDYSWEKIAKKTELIYEELL